MSNHPWDRQRHAEHGLEPMLWFGRFTQYRKMGTERSLLGAVNRVNKSKKRQTCIPGAWSDACKKWEWKGRAEKWDLYEIERKRIKFEAECDEWTTERFKDARSLRSRAREYLALPVVEEEVINNGKTYIIKPLAPVQAKAAASILKIADELARITTRETLPVQKIAPVMPDGKEPYEPDRHAGQRLVLIRQLVAAEQATSSGPDTDK